MLAAQFTPESGFSIVEADRQPLNKGEVRLRVDACGVCGSDRQVLKGESVPAGTVFPLIMGHEISGTVVETGEHADDWQAGDQVVVYPFISCGTCSPCKNNQPNLCIRQKCIGYHLPGGFAEEVIVPAGQLIRMSKRCSSAAAALLVDAFATPYHAMSLSDIQAGGTVLVIGTGGLGLATLQLAKIFEAGQLGAVTRRVSGVKAAEKYGAQMCVSTQDGARSTARKIRRWSGAGGVDVVIDTVANKETAAMAFDVVRPGGTVTIIGMSEDTASIPIAKTVRRGIRIIASFGSMINDVRKLMDLTDSGQLDPTKLIAGTLQLQNVNQAFADDRASSGRWIIKPNDQTR
ncbi:alcohol dehydrogenase catalytic domain-containing protein [Scopulibacillus cellulosilyticus]|uniref:Alcohol dehydrogenase catalytic domain-containing protein n=1 Tax=Scopulibacillus cellulosilyticus TaxID=2665665 RepID=A0ABW2Q1S3_9BACL